MIRHTLLALASVFLVQATARAGVVVDVSGQDSVYLAGMPNGTTLPAGDIAPAQSPAEVLGLDIAGGGSVTFAAGGSASYNSGNFSGPEGLAVFPFERGAANGISGYGMLANALIGVFLGPNRPDVLPNPAALDFRGAAARDYLELAPVLQQVFFIGDGFTSGGVAQKVVIPTGATRLFLGLADGIEWNNNGGSFRVTVDLTPIPPSAVVPEPATLASAALGLLGLAVRRAVGRK
ncbi:MAG: PEP-CTERM sorting domain-containing protein [Isosphaeraceae bacterium]|nr:PEP-CTERM sorting domain-containing protein [Isosphaeraceae bacterium]